MNRKKVDMSECGEFEGQRASRRARHASSTLRVRSMLFEQRRFPGNRSVTGNGPRRTWTETSERGPSVDSRMRRTPPGVTHSVMALDIS